MAFSFGQPSGTSASSSGGLFGTSGATGQSSGGLFGSSGANNSGTTGGSLFGNAGATGGAAGTGNTGTGWSFGQNSNTQNTGSTANASGGLFGQKPNTQNTGSAGNSSGGLFGQTSTTPNTGSTGNTTGGIFGQASTTQNTGATGNTSGGLFAGGSTGGNIFGNNAGSSSQAPGTPGQPATSKPSLFGSTTPAASGPTNFFGNPSTTPAGQPPANSIFGASTGGATSQPQATSKPAFSFGPTPAATSSTTSTTPAPTSNLFGGQGQQAPAGGLFAPKPSSTPASTGGGLFGQQPANAASQPASTGGLFAPKSDASSTTPAPASSNPFGGFKLSGGGASGSKEGPSDDSKKPSENNQSSTSGSGFPSFGSKDKPAFSFPTSSQEQPPSSQPASSAPAFGGIFAKPNAPASQTTDKPKTGFFSQTSTSASQPSATGTAPAPTFNLGATQPQASSTTSTTAAPAASAPAPGLFNLGGSTANAAGTTSTTKGPSTFTASTAGPAATAQSRLRNKTMDEILTRWASDLTRYTKEFKAHAETIAHWDQIIVDNSAKIDKLYIKTRTCEKQTMSVEMQLTAVENQQNELEAWLNKYENDVDEMLAKDGPTQNELGGPDLERERTYKLAEKLGERLDDMGRDLQSMIEEVNAANAGLGKSSKADEPVSVTSLISSVPLTCSQITQIVKILNSHLSQLQAIDQGTSALQMKVSAAQKAASGMNYMNGGLNGDNRAAVDDFYRSYMGRR